MAIILNYKNVGELVFSNKKLLPYLSEYKEYIDNWYFGKRAGFMKHLVKSAEMNFLKNIKEKDIKKLSDILGETVFVDNDIFKTILNLNTSIDRLELDLPVDFNFIDLSVFRRKDKIEVTIWR